MKNPNIKTVDTWITIELKDYSDLVKYIKSGYNIEDTKAEIFSKEFIYYLAYNTTDKVLEEIKELQPQNRKKGQEYRFYSLDIPNKYYLYSYFEVGENNKCSILVSDKSTLDSEKIAVSIGSRYVWFEEAVFQDIFSWIIKNITKYYINNRMKDFITLLKL